MNKFFRILGIVLACLALLSGITVLTTNLVVIGSTNDRVYTVDQAVALEGMDCILVLGCGVREDGTPSRMLEDRLARAVELYHSGAAPKLLMSGDHGREGYNEVGVMKDYAIKHGVPSEDIFMDHAGFSTYESVYRAKAIFGVERFVIVTQGYHLSRALYIADAFEIEAYGVTADRHRYTGQLMRDIREVLARTKDTFYCLFKPAPTYLGEAIPVSGNGDVTQG